MKIKFVTYNICHGEGLDGKIDIKRQANLIKEIDPNVVFLQEVDIYTDRCGKINEIDEFSKYSNMTYYSEGINLEYQNGFYANGILSKTQIINPTKYLFDKTEENSEQRNATYGQIVINDKKFHLFCVHLSTNKDERILAINKLLDIISKIDTNEYIILGGDFNFGISKIAKHKYIYNAEEANKEYEILKPKLRRIPNTDLTWFSETGKACIDTFFYSKNVKNIKFETIESEFSDHYPIVLEIEL